MCAASTGRLAGVTVESKATPEVILRARRVARTMAVCVIVQLVLIQAQCIRGAACEGGCCAALSAVDPPPLGTQKMPPVHRVQ